MLLLEAALAFSPAARGAAGDLPTQPPQLAADSGLYIKVRLTNPVKSSKLKPGDVVEGTLARDVYSASHKVLSAGDHVRLTVDHLERRRRARNDHWPWVVNAFTPRHETYPIFTQASVVEGASEVGLRVSLISLSRTREVHAQARKNKSGETSAQNQGAVEASHSNVKTAALPTMVLEAFSSAETEHAGGSSADVDRSGIVPAGTRCKILLLGDVSASKSKPGDVVAARLLEPVVENSKVVLPAGSLFEGKVVRKTPPRWLSRPGSLYLTFTKVTLPGENPLPISASVAGAELDRRSHTRIDAEGGIHGEHQGKAWMAINLGITAGVAKEVDDSVQLVIEAIVSTATDASTAGTARIISSCVSGLYMATRRGRDVVLPRFSEMEISLDRPVSLHASGAAVAVSASGQ
jgi:hypothetical protein